jgi:hypothetical protein
MKTSRTGKKQQKETLIFSVAFSSSEQYFMEKSVRMRGSLIMIKNIWKMES